MSKQNSRSLDVVFCDDIRMEVGNKTTLVGVYHPTITIDNSFVRPFTMPKLCGMTTAKADKEHPFQKLVFRLLKDGQGLNRIEIPDSNLDEAASAALADPDSAGCYITAIFTLMPLAIDKSCVLSVLAKTESEELKDWSLRIIVNPPAQATA